MNLEIFASAGDHRIAQTLTSCEQGIAYAVIVDDVTVWSRFVHWEQGQRGRAIVADEQERIFQECATALQPKPGAS